jgi:acyl carrier protein
MHLKKKSNKNKNTFADENIIPGFIPTSFGVLVFSIESISDRVLKVIREYNNGQEFNLSYADRPFTEQGFDSLGFVLFIQEIESEFDINIPDEEAQNLTTFNILVRYLERILITG